MKSLWDSWPTLRKCIATKKGRILLLLDFDGTLAPLAKDPKTVLMPARTRALLRILNRRKGMIVSVISGRSLKDVRARIRIPNVIYVGNHGLEIAGRGLRPPSGSRRVRANPTVRRLAGMFRSVFYFWPGVLVEDKVYSLSLHFRNLRSDRKPVFDELIAFYQRKFKKYPVVWKKGKKVWEIRPLSGWGKGDAARYLSKKFPKALPIAVGDDDTDEDMFRILRPGGITIRVGYSKRSSAQYFIRSSKEVGVLLGRLCDANT